jgi:toxin-antitoxin system PIN domain toxin
MRHLCDSNVLVALVAGRHLHHARALAWFEGFSPDDSLAICRMTQLSFLRLITTQAVMQADTCSNTEAVAVLATLQSDARIEWIAHEPAGLARTWMNHSSLGQSAPKLWMDAYLVAFAMCAQVRFVTFDRGFDRFRAAGLDLLLL